MTIAILSMLVEGGKCEDAAIAQVKLHEPELSKSRGNALFRAMAVFLIGNARL